MSAYFTYSEVAFSKAKDPPVKGVEAPLEGRSQRMSEDIRPLNPPRYMEDANVCIRVYRQMCILPNMPPRVYTSLCNIRMAGIN